MQRLLVPLVPLLESGFPESEDEKLTATDPAVVRAILDPGYEVLKCGEALKEVGFFVAKITLSYWLALHCNCAEPLSWLSRQQRQRHDTTVRWSHAPKALCIVLPDAG